MTIPWGVEITPRFDPLCNCNGLTNGFYRQFNRQDMLTEGEAMADRALVRKQAVDDLYDFAINGAHE